MDIIHGFVHITPEEAYLGAVMVVDDAKADGVESVGYMELCDGSTLDVWRDEWGRLIGSYDPEMSLPAGA